MGLYGLEGVELLWDRSIDMKALVGWSGDGRIVIAFRWARLGLGAAAARQGGTAGHAKKQVHGWTLPGRT